MANFFLTGILFILNNPYPLLCTRSNVMLETIYRIKVIQATEARPFDHFIVFGFYLMKAVIYTYLLIIPFRGAYMRYLLSFELSASGLLNPLSSGYLSTEYVHLDPLMTLGVLNFHFLDQKTMFATSLLALFALYIDYSLSFQSNLPITKMMHEINIGNIRQITELNRSILTWPKMSFFKPVESVRIFSGWIRRIWNCESLNFYHPQLECYPTLSKRLRARIMVFSLGLELFFLLIILLVGLFVIIFLLLFFFYFIIQLPLQTIIIAVIDGTLMGYGAWNAVRMGFFSLHVIAMQAFITRGRISELNSAISLSIIQSRNSKSALLLKRAVVTFRREHRYLLRVAVTINDLVSSRLMIITFLTNIFDNVMMIAKLIFELPLLSAEAAVVFLIILAQTAISLPACFVQITWAKALYSSASIHLLYISQPMLREIEQQKQNGGFGTFGGLLGTVMLVEKLKLNLYFELVCTQMPFIFTLGQLGGISKKSLYEFFFCYSGFIMYTSKIIIKSQLAKVAASVETN